jgi:nicotinate-nucleotide adenylyltransferase
MQVAFFGGSFDPPHAGHVLLSAYLGTVAGFDRVLVAPVFGHAFDKPLSAFEHRLRMCELAFARLPFVEVSAIESTLEAPNYTLHTLQAIKQAHPDWQLRLAIGSDVLAETSQWYQFEAVSALAPPFVFARRGSAEAESGTHLLPEVSSGELRKRLRRAGDPAVRRALGDLMAPAVIEYAIEKGLYL